MRLDSRPTQIALPTRRRRVRAQRVLCLALVPLLGAPLVLLGRDGPPAPAAADAQVSVRSVGGRSSDSPAPPPPAAAVPIRSLRQAPVTAPPTTAVPTTTEAPTTTTSTYAPTTTAAPTTTTTAAPTTTAVPARAAVEPAPATTPPTTAARPPATSPPAPPHSQRGQATWYRWKAGNCAHNSLPKGTVVTVRATASGRTETCTVGDRGAFREPTIIDLDATVFEKIAPLGAGRIAVTITWK